MHAVTQVMPDYSRPKHTQLRRGRANSAGLCHPLPLLGMQDIMQGYAAVFSQLVRLKRVEQLLRALHAPLMQQPQSTAGGWPAACAACTGLNSSAGLSAPHACGQAD